MARADTPAGGNVLEACEACDAETPHEVSVQLRTESHKEQNAEFSREPYRITECTRCGTRDTQRMNDA
ncbi:hypothetical protein BRD17_03720 [Halobacteriales archaeon SW_7_68_16]|nr:MAG: hypothetical protein BRD17_03720 [Halobacteriales archaeon SW_7_68_16]